MSPSPIARSADLSRLREEGYALSLLSGHLVVSDVPVVDPHRRVARGRLVVPLELAGDVTVPPTRHSAWWSGPAPCDSFGATLDKVAHPLRPGSLGPGIPVDRMMCVKPVGREFLDYHELVTTYVALLGAPVAVVDPTASARVGPHSPRTDAQASPFRYADTATARSGTGALSARLAGGPVAIVGLGGTGSYVLDLVAKTPVPRIHLFDGDVFDQHNAFRAPGAPSVEDVRTRRAKVDHFAAIYSRIHRGIVPHRTMLHRDNVGLLDGIGFAFVCVDNGPSRRTIVEELERRDVPFVDVGMGLEATEAGVTGLVRVTTSTPGMRGHVHKRGRIPFDAGSGTDPYAANVQVADLNALNAALAVVRWKKLHGFYQDEDDRRHTLYALGGNVLVNEDRAPSRAGPVDGKPRSSGREAWIGMPTGNSRK